ncbi:DUF1887 family CARF protein [Belliella sp. DSM 111904]|uniref:DUF1887 family CARF protein n=1 Tax=Belliella filtrata TaxID=2923435 RepID=A0ABS9V4U5_9BACT|nr:DUF1887 family CARF protein [Belliella filtrata]MCH7411426.1 DUF1887 family CARF protein [Belliella filtrata]
MSKSIIVSLVSDQTIPNVIFIRDMPKADAYIFITTNKMEKKHIVENIINSCPEGLIENSQKIIVEEDSLVDFKSIVSGKLESSDDNHYYVNITGGTKIMSLGAYNFFTELGDSTIYYLPLGKDHFRQIFPIKKNKTKLVGYKINLKDYLTANGVTVQTKAFTGKNSLIRSKEENLNLMNAFLGDLNYPIKKMVEFFRFNKLRDKKNLELTDQIRKEMEPIFQAGFNLENENVISRGESNYLTGDWFEEYTYQVIAEALDKTNEEIGKGIRVTRGLKTSNEFDVMFTHNNALYVIECKTDVADNEEGKLSQLFTNTLYKASTLKKDFGLFVKYYLFAVNDFSKLSDEHKDRARVLDIKLVGTEILSDRTKLIEFIQKM